MEVAPQNPHIIGNLILTKIRLDEFDVSLLRSGALGMNCHPERASVTEGSSQRIRGDPSPRVTRLRMTLKRRHSMISWTAPLWEVNNEVTLFGTVV